jgi:hypothetical protein
VKRQGSPQADGFTAPQIASLLDKLHADYGQKITRLIGKDFTKEILSLSASIQESYDNTNPNQNNPFLYGDRRVNKGRVVTLIIRGKTYSILKRFFRSIRKKPVFIGIEVKLERSLRYATESVENKGIDFRTGGDRDYAYTVRHADRDEEVRVLFDSVITAPMVGTMDDSVKSAIESFERELSWQWFGSTRK